VSDKHSPPTLGEILQSSGQMLAALERVDMFYPKGNPELTPDHPMAKSLLKPEELEIWREVRAAIAKARGE
jgi:hypothetical protein